MRNWREEEGKRRRSKEKISCWQPIIGGRRAGHKYYIYYIFILLQNFKFKICIHWQHKNVFLKIWKSKWSIKHIYIDCESRLSIKITYQIDFYYQQKLTTIILLTLNLSIIESIKIYIFNKRWEIGVYLLYPTTKTMWNPKLQFNIHHILYDWFVIATHNPQNVKKVKTTQHHSYSPPLHLLPLPTLKEQNNLKKKKKKKGKSWYRQNQSHFHYLKRKKKLFSPKLYN